MDPDSSLDAFSTHRVSVAAAAVCFFEKRGGSQSTTAAIAEQCQSACSRLALLPLALQTR